MKPAIYSQIVLQTEIYMINRTNTTEYCRKWDCTFIHEKTDESDPVRVVVVVVVEVSFTTLKVIGAQRGSGYYPTNGPD